MLTDDFISKYKEKQPNWGFNGLGYVTFKRTYARPKDDGSTEEWWETVQRCVEWLMQTQKELGIENPMSYYEELYDTVFNLKASFSGRMLWQAGTKTVNDLGGASLCNCYAVVVDSKEAFLSTLDYLMLGGGVGYNIQQQHVAKLPTLKDGIEIKRQDADDAGFIVPDSREGWISLLNQILTSFFETGKSFTYSLHLVRKYGEPIKGFGGVASGPEPLEKGMTKIIDVLKKREGKNLRPIDALDIMNCIGELVVAGNVRRSAQIALGDASDVQFLKAKDWDSGVIPNHRAMSNNTIVCNDIHTLPENFWEGYNGSGEPYGLFNIKLAREKGRLSDNHRTDPDVVATNPCSEISLAPKNGGAESCNLCEIFLNNIKDADEFERVARLMHSVVKTIALLPYHHKPTEDIIHENLRLGIGLTGIVQSPELTTAENLTRVYRAIEDEDSKWDRKSIKLTTVKPSGTLSLLGGATPGVHPAYSQFYKRRIRMSKDDSLVDMCKKAGYRVENVKNFDGTDDEKTVVVEFPIQIEEGTMLAKDIRAVEQLELHKHIQKYWSDNQVSVTVYFKKEELAEIREWLKENYNENVKSVSFLLHSDHGFSQAPYEEISESEYLDISSKIKSLDFGSKVEEATLSSSVECTTGGCPIR